jgi:SAM-dependent methyltransferase
LDDSMEQRLKNQDRWNSDYGKASLAAFQSSPDKFLVDPTKFSRERLDLIEALTDVRGKRILEYGSGRGEFAVALAKSGAVVTGLDVGEDLVGLSRAVASLNKAQCDFLVGSVDRLEFDDSSFDFVVGNHVLHHLTKRDLVDSLLEADRVLRPGGMALFTEPIEDSKAFDFVQNLVPIGKPDAPDHRPSILQKAEWKRYAEGLDDRALSSAELTGAKGRFRSVEFKYYGLLIRLARLSPNVRWRESLTIVDRLLTHRLSPFRRLSQSVLVIYRK